jgi:2-C-methyl-D-erythritol 4-phosphate cytidylyltransferase
MSVAALIAAAGSGRRMGRELEKQFLPLGGKPLLAHTLSRFEMAVSVDCVVVVVPPGRETFCRHAIVEAEGFRKVTHVVAGAETRQRSVMTGFGCLDEGIDIVVVHDGARPFVTPELIEAAIAAARRVGCAIAAIPESDTLKRVATTGLVQETLDRQHLWRAQTPQAFQRPILRGALEYAGRQRLDVTDEAALVEALALPVQIIPGSIWNFKITSPDDLQLAELVVAHHPSGGLPSAMTMERV